MDLQPRRFNLVAILDAENEADVGKKSDDSLTGHEPVSVIIPTLNEGENIADLLIRLHQALTQHAIVYEVIVVDDHSTDNTVAAAVSVAKEKNLPVRVLTKRGRRGKSFSLMEGFAAARYDVMAMMDGDLQHPPEVLVDMLSCLADSDLVVADRRGGPNDLHLRGLMSLVFTFLVRVLFGIDTDIESGLKVFHRNVYEGLPINPGQWGFDLHLVTQAVRNGHALHNMPFTVQKRTAGKSKVKPVLVGSQLLVTALLLKMKLALGRTGSGTRTHRQHHRGHRPVGRVAVTATPHRHVAAPTALPQAMKDKEPPVDHTLEKQRMRFAAWLAIQSKTRPLPILRETSRSTARLPQKW